MENSDSESKFPELVAYLDGELAPEQKQEVETRLAADREYRQELAQLQKSWDMLDILPTVQATEAFTQSTVEMVAVSAATQVHSSRNWIGIRNVLWVILLIAIPTSAFCYGFWKTRRDLNADNVETINDLAIIQRFPVYRSVNADISPEKSIQFLELLVSEKNKADVFISFDEDESESINRENFQIHLQQTDLNPESIGDARLGLLSENKALFNQLESQKDNMRRFHQMLENHPDEDNLVAALCDYYVWFRSRVFLSSQQEIDKIKDAGPTERMKLIHKMELDHFRNSFRYIQKGRRIPAMQDYRKIKAFGREILGRIRDEFIERMATTRISDDPDMVAIVDALKSAPSDHHFFSLMIRFSSQLYGDEFVNPFFDPDQIRPFLNELSDESKATLEGLPDSIKFTVVQLWIFSTLGNIDNSELAQFEDKVLTGAQRSSLNQLNNYQKKREILSKAFFYTLEPFGISPTMRKLPDDLMELEDWKPFPEPGSNSNSNSRD